MFINNMNESQMRELWKLEVAHWMRQQTRTMEECGADFWLSQFSKYKAELLREIEGMKKRIISEVRQKAYDEGFEKGRAHGYEVASYERHWE